MDSPAHTPPLFATACLNLTAGVSILELVLILAMKHLREVHPGEALNFEMVFDGVCVCVCVCMCVCVCVCVCLRACVHAFLHPYVV